MASEKKINWRIFLMEIFSIFIGITAAFWLDNWNKNRLQEIEEIKILEELKNGFESTLEDMSGNLAGHRYNRKASLKLMQFINGELKDTDSVMYYYERSLVDYTFTPNTGGYETLKSRGVQILSNDSLRLKIINLYDFNFKMIKRLEEEEEAFRFYDNYAPALMTRLSKMKLTYYKNGLVSSIDYPKNFKPRKDEEFILLTKNISNSHGIMSNFYFRTSREVRKIIEEIQTEIDRLKG